jgi:hypothetical protein
MRLDSSAVRSSPKVPGRLKLIKISDFGAAGVWDEALQDVAAVVSMSDSASGMIGNMDAAVEKGLHWFYTSRSRQQHGIVKSFAFTN